MPSWPHCNTCRNLACSCISSAQPCSTDSPSYTEPHYNQERLRVKERLTVKAILTVKEIITVKVGQESRRYHCQRESESHVEKTISER